MDGRGNSVRRLIPIIVDFDAEWVCKVLRETTEFPGEVTEELELYT